MTEKAFDLGRLLKDVFAPRPGERVVVMVDEPHGPLADHADWQERRRMAAQWIEGFRNLGLATRPLLTCPATGAHNSDLPAQGIMDGRAVVPAEVLLDCDIAVAMTEYSATAPLMALVNQSGGRLRAASMPGVLRRMESSALAADYRAVAARVRRLADLLSRAESASVVFSTGHRVRFDLRFRQAHGDEGLCRPDSQQRVINLPSGEAYIVPYEGERPGIPSLTRGRIPVQLDDEVVLLEIEANRIARVTGDGEEARRLRDYFAVDPARANVAELGLGCNDRAIVTGNVLEDEKAGLHWAYGRSEHLGGTVGPDAFTSPENVVHRDIVYARNCPIGVQSLDLAYPDGTTEQILRDGEYLIF